MGSRIRTRREALGLTQGELGARVGVRQQKVAKWEAGESNPTLDHLVAVAATLGLTTDQLLGVDKTKPPTASVEQAIMTDRTLSTSARRALLDAYAATRSLPGRS